MDVALDNGRRPHIAAVSGPIDFRHPHIVISQEVYGVGKVRNRMNH